MARSNMPQMRAMPLAVAIALGVACTSALPTNGSAPAEQVSPSTRPTEASAAPTATPGSVPPTSPVGSPTAAAASTRAPTLVTERSGDDLAIAVSGLMPAERLDVSVRLATSRFTSAFTADQNGDLRLIVPLRGDIPIEVMARRGSGEELRAVLGVLSPASASPVATPVAPSPVATLSPVTTTAPTPAPVVTATPIPTAAAVGTPSAEPSCPTAPVDPARTGIDGYVRYGRQPLAGFQVEIHEGDIGGGIVGTATTAADGQFRVLGLARLGQYRVHVRPQGTYAITGAPSAQLVCTNTVVRAPTLPNGEADQYTPHGVQMGRTLTGFSIQHDSAVPAGRVTLRWDRVVDASYYCVGVFDYTSQRDLLQGPCFVGTFPVPARVRSNDIAYTTPELLVGRRYGIVVSAIMEGLLNPLGANEVQFTTSATY